MQRGHVFLAAGAAGLVAIGGAVALSAVSTDERGSVPTQQPKMTQAAVATIPVKGMVCMACAAAIKQEVASLDGVLSAEVRLADQVDEIRYAGDPTVPAKAAAAINKLGYKAGKPV